MKPLPISRRICDAVRDIDACCDSISRGIERGLCNVKLHYRDLIMLKRVVSPRTGLKEEDTISWQIKERISGPSCGAELWQNYPGTAKTCDLVIHSKEYAELWLEVKLAWKDGDACCFTTLKSWSRWR